MTDRDIMRLALDALTSGVDVQMGRVVWTEYDSGLIAKAVTALTERLAQPEQEPVAYPDGDVVGPCICGSWPGGKCLKCPRITTPPQRKPLSDEEVGEIYYGITRQRSSISGSWIKTFARAIEAAHGIKEGS